MAIELKNRGRRGQLTTAKRRALKSPFSGKRGVSDIHQLSEDR